MDLCPLPRSDRSTGSAGPSTRPPLRRWRCIGPLIYIDLVGLGPDDEAKARKILLEGVKQTPKTLKPPNFSSLVSANQAVTIFGAPFPEHWNVARRHVPYFTGRDELIEQIFQEFASRRDVAQIPDPQAIVGLGGLGKTQTAAEYAYRYRNKYQAVLWARADCKENLIADYHALIGLLGLPKQDDPIKALQPWFTTQSNWLLILDNADDLAVIDPFLPRSQPGHVLITTRVRAARNIAAPLLLESLRPEDGALCILRRAGSIKGTEQLHDAPPVKVDAARRISELMAGLPLALEQAGAYIEDTGGSESRYLAIYERHRAEVLQRHFGALPNYPLPVAAAWTFSKGIVQQKEPAAFALLQLCAFLAPDAIPEEIFSNGAPALGSDLEPLVSNPFRFDLAMIILRQYSLLNREVKGKEEVPRFSMHRIMQDIIRDEMSEDAQRQWAERAVRAVSLSLSAGSDPTMMQPHVRHCLPLIERWGMKFSEAEHVQEYAEGLCIGPSILKETRLISSRISTRAGWKTVLPRSRVHDSLSRHLGNGFAVPPSCSRCSHPSTLRATWCRRSHPMPGHSNQSNTLHQHIELPCKRAFAPFSRGFMGHHASSFATSGHNSGGSFESEDGPGPEHAH